MGDPTGLRLATEGPDANWIVTGPAAPPQVKLKGWPSTTSNTLLVKKGCWPLTVAMIPAKAAMVNFMAAVMFGYHGR